MHNPDSYSLRSYGRMINDRARSQPFVDALRKLVRPGSTALEIGTASGYFAFLCAQLGADRVYAVEPDGAIEVAKLCAADVPGSERITWIKGISTRLALPERVDLVFGDLHGTLPFYNHNIESMVDARLRHLKPGGSIIPMRDTVRVVPAQAPHEYRNVDEPWLANAEGLDLSSGRSFVANDWWRARSEPARADDLLATPATWGAIDYRSVTSSNLDGEMQWTVERPGTLHGYYVWFDGELAEGIGYSNAPDLPELVYGRAFFPLERAIEVAAGDRIDARFSARLVSDKRVMRWNTRIGDAEGRERARFEQSTFRARPVDRAALERTAAEHVPQLGREGRIDLSILGAMAQGQPLSRIATDLQQTYPQEFPTAAKAMARAARLSFKYGDQGPETP